MATHPHPIMVCKLRLYATFAYVVWRTIKNITVVHSDYLIASAIMQTDSKKC